MTAGVSSRRSYSDPCRPFNIMNQRVAVRREVRRANCRAILGFTDAELDSFAPPFASFGKFESGGNPDLDSESSSSFTAGTVITPRFILNLNITVDYYSIDISGIITQVGTTTIPTLCVDSQTINNQYCPLITRNPDTREIELVRDIFINSDDKYTSGIDVGISYWFSVKDTLDLLPWKFKDPKDWGSFSFSFNSQSLLNFIDSDSFGNKISRAGRFGRPRLEGVGSINYSYKNLSLNWTIIWEDGTRKNDPNPLFRIPENIYNDLFVSYFINYKKERRFRASLAILDLFDQDPRPHVWTHNGGIGDRVLGRTFSATLSLEF